MSCTNFASTMVTLLVSNPLLPQLDLSCLRIASCGGSPLPPATVRRAIAAFGCPFFISYGMTECCGKHVTTTDGLLQSQVCSCLVWGPLAKLMWQVRLSMTCCHCCKQDSSIIPTIHIDHAHDVTYDSDADTCPHDHINFCIALIL